MEPLMVYHPAFIRATVLYAEVCVKLSNDRMVI